MGWDAFTLTAKNEDVSSGLMTKDPKFYKYKAVFKDESKRVKDIAGSVDAFLQDGCLDCSDCAEMLQKAVGESVWTSEIWSVEKVQKLADYADWDFEFERDYAWAYYSAKAFLETCAKLKLQIKFSF